MTEKILERKSDGKKKFPWLIVLATGGIGLAFGAIPNLITALLRKEYR